MKKIMTAMLGLALVFGLTGSAFAQGTTTKSQKTKKTKTKKTTSTSKT